MIAFLGMGLLGANFTRKQLELGETVHVWNRSPARARALEADGARAFDAAVDAVRGARRVHIAVSEDAAVDALLEQVRPGLEADVIVVDHSTTSPDGTRARATLWASRGTRFLHAPVFMGPMNAREATGSMLASGDRATFEAVQADLGRMTGRLLYLGPEPDRAAACKLLGNMFLVCMTTGLSDALAYATAEGVPMDQVRELFTAFNPATQLLARMQRIVDGDFASPSWELAMARKDVRLMLEGAAAHGAALALVPAIASLMDTWIGRGHAHDDWMVVATDSVKRPA
jgi:3-hydroxyisobutyrate dehydrogenase